MGNILRMSDYITEYRKFDISHPKFERYSKELQNKYPVLKYICTKSKYNRLKVVNNDVIGNITCIKSLPEPYYDYLCCDMCNGYLEMYYDKTQYDDIENTNILNIRIDAYDDIEKYVIMYYLIFKRDVLDAIKNRMERWNK